VRCKPENLRSCKVAVVGEAPGAEEEASGLPFQGPSGRLLNAFLRAAGIKREDVLVTNVFMERPKGNKIGLYFEKKAAAKASGNDSDLPACAEMGVIKKEWRPEIDRLQNELKQANPNIIIALGVTALWALTGLSKINAYRGVALPCTLLPNKKVLATFHPAAVLRDWSLRPIATADIMKAAKESDTSEIRRTQRIIWLADKLSDLELFEKLHIRRTGRFATDVETEAGDITHISFAADATKVLVVPFWDKRRDGWHYWSAEDEPKVWLWVYKILEDPALVKILHNSLYDLTYFSERGIHPRGVVEDSMLLHHALQPELRKSLGFLGSLYSSEAAWKMLRTKPQSQINKKDE
jgi:uracil-DNA glycosylase